ncbi:Pyridoxal phosphate-dependent decarboxylase [Corchorus olitorius]|uniref:Pyridoxal phosphate-dependent decarboxylase n=1 Tax=Corchorus olitorius TaxID=93759 RepID=A0A1R3KMQ0_9ROSI|nr:Pyridoxal phosphate-dependent decarboxylase [Corchorus olitorius]
MGSTSRKTFFPLEPMSFRNESNEVIDFIADYYQNIEEFPVQSRVEPGYLSAKLPDSAPFCPESLQDILKDVNDCILPGLTHWQSPNFFAYFQANASTAGFLGEMLCSGFNVVGGGVLHGSTCEAAVCTLAAARDKALKKLGGWENITKLVGFPCRLTNMDCCCLWIKEPKFLVESLSSDPEYLRNNASESKFVIDYKDWQIALSRRFRALKLWVVIRRHGLANLMYHIRSDMSMTKRFEEFVTKDERFEIVVPRKFALVCFRINPKEGVEGNELNRKLLEAINSIGKAFTTHAIVGGIYVIRCAIGTILTEQRHVDDLWKLIQEKAQSLLMGKI